MDRLFEPDLFFHCLSTFHHSEIYLFEPKSYFPPMRLYEKKNALTAVGLIALSNHSLDVGSTEVNTWPSKEVPILFSLYLSKIIISFSGGGFFISSVITKIAQERRRIPTQRCIFRASCVHDWIPSSSAH